MDFLVIDCW